MATPTGTAQGCPDLPPLPDDVVSRLIEAIGADDAVARVEALIADLPGHGAAIRQWAAAAASLGHAATDGVDPPSLLQRLQRDADSRARITAAEPTAGKYELGERIGRGSFGEVWEAVDRDLGRTVAIKLQHGDQVDQPDRVRRFLEEAQIAAQLQHPGILPVYEAGVAGRRPFFAMQLARHESWDLSLRRRSHPGVDLQRHLGILLQVCQTLAFAHSRGVIHRDLKPMHVLLGRFGEVHVVDWGLAKVLQRPESGSGGDPGPDTAPPIATTRTDPQHASVEGLRIGSPPYMPPEQAAGDLARVDRRSDVFGLGAILFEVLTMHCVYEVDRGGGGDPADRALRLLQLAAAADLEPARRHLAACGAHPGLIALCQDCLRADPAQRPADAGAVATRLQAHLDDVQARAERARVDAARARTRQRWLLAFAGAVVTGLVAVTALFREASAAHREASARLREFDEMSYLVTVRELTEREQELRADWPARAVELRQFLTERVEPLLAALPGLQARVAELRDQAPGSSDPRTAATLQLALTQVTAAIESFRDHQVLGLEPHQLRDATEPVHDASLRGRIDWAERGRKLSIDDAAAAWRQAIDAVARADGVTASAAYGPPGRIRLSPQLGLVPIGIDPVSRLWEFHHLRSARAPDVAPQRRSDGSVDPTDDLGLVFVLLPGGAFVMGQQSTQPDAPRYHAAADANETPPHEVALGPFLLSKFEMTQAQWFRLTGRKPSQLGANSKLVQRWAAHPVEWISCAECDELLASLGLCLPTEAQWEYACRASTDGPWPVDRDRLATVANLADRFARENGGHDSWQYELDLDDGFTAHAPVGSFAPNAFGLFDMLGNIEEWCSDEFCRYGGEVEPETGARRGEPVRPARILRGGSFARTAEQSRSSHRFAEPASASYVAYGLRPARRLRP